MSAKIETKNLSDFYNNDNNGKSTYPSNYENVNYKCLNNKDGKFAWRPFQLINPALYVSLVHKMTNESNWKLIIERFEEFRQNPNIKKLTFITMELTEKKNPFFQSL